MVAVVRDRRDHRDTTGKSADYVSEDSIGDGFPDVAAPRHGCVLSGVGSHEAWPPTVERAHLGHYPPSVDS